MRRVVGVLQGEGKSYLDFYEIWLTLVSACICSILGITNKLKGRISDVIFVLMESTYIQNAPSKITPIPQHKECDDNPYETTSSFKSRRTPAQ